MMAVGVVELVRHCSEFVLDTFDDWILVMAGMDYDMVHYTRV